MKIKDGYLEILLQDHIYSMEKRRFLNIRKSLMIGVHKVLLIKQILLGSTKALSSRVQRKPA